MNLLDLPGQKKHVFSFNRIILVASILQIGLLSYWFSPPILLSILWIVFLCFTFLFSRKFLHVLNSPGIYEHFWITWSFGGLGMILGHQLDLYFHQVPHHALHQIHMDSSMSLTSFLFSGMTIVMLLFCTPTCSLICNKKLHEYGVEKWIVHGISTLFMLVGMLTAMNLSRPSMLEDYKGILLDHHLMLILMVLCSSSVYYLTLKALSQVKHPLWTNQQKTGRK